MDLGDADPLRVEPVGPVGPSETQGRESAAGLALSVILHGIALCLLLVVGVFGTEALGSEGAIPSPGMTRCDYDDSASDMVSILLRNMSR
jgi:hypothetical protein